MRELEQFLGGYFHEDWLLEHQTWTEQVDAYAFGHGDEAVQRSLTELNDLLAAPVGERDLEDLVFRRLGCYYYPQAAGQSMREWLGDVRDRLKWHLGRGRPD